MSPKMWTAQINWKMSAANVAEDIKGDWYRDPWGWPEYSFVLDDAPELIEQRALQRGVKRVAKIDVPKGNFATRPAVVLEPLDRLVFQGLVDAVSRKLIGDANSFVFGWRLDREVAEAGVYRDNAAEWDLYRANLQRLVSVASIGLRTDIVSCFASISVDRVSEDVERLAGRNKITSRLTDIIDSYSRIPGRSGIPQRSLASCVLANLYLGRIDRVLKEYELTNKSFWATFASGSLTTRWMDDIWAFAWDEATLRSLQYDLENEARAAGLELNSAKTEVLEGDALAAEALRLEHSAVDEALRRESPDHEPLEELIDKILIDPPRADRTSIHFATTRMRRRKVWTRLSRLAQEAQRMPQGADHLARVFRDFGVWEQLQDWYLDYEKSDWARNSWAASQFGTMFPSKAASVAPALQERFLEILANRPQLPMLALTAQRLAAWRPDEARDCMRSLADSADHPLERRILALAGLAVREESVYIRSLLSEYEENALTLRAVEARGFRPYDAVPDFATRS